MILGQIWPKHANSTRYRLTLIAMINFNRNSKTIVFRIVIRIFV